MAMSIKILYFASLREALGRGNENLDLPGGVNTVATLKHHLAARGEAWVALMTTKNLRAAVNQQMANADTELADGDEVAFFPPVTGG
jgi:molybdopterin synthase sulfur carrier subunit